MNGCSLRQIHRAILRNGSIAEVLWGISVWSVLFDRDPCTYLAFFFETLSIALARLRFGGHGDLGSSVSEDISME